MRPGPGIHSVGFGSNNVATAPLREILYDPPFTKDEYNAAVKRQRQNFVFKHFGIPLAEISRLLRDDAEKMRVCRREISFEVPDHFDVDKMESILRLYFEDLGYKPLVEQRNVKDATESRKILITLT